MATSVGSLCTGYGGLDLAINAAFGATRLAWVSDIEAGPCKVLAHRYPDVPNLGDLTKVDWRDVELVEVLTAGYPCQPFSQAGRRRGETDDRHIWPYIRDAIGVLRPRLVVLENVAGHLSLGGTRVIGDLAAAGYDARWVVVRAADVGACHRRARWFCVAHTDRYLRGRDDREVPGTQSGVGCRGDGDGPGNGGSGLVAHPDLSDGFGREHEPLRRSQSRTTPVGPDAHVPADAHHGRREQRDALERRLPEPCALDARIDFGKYAAAVRHHELALGRLAPAPTDTKRRLNPAFVEWMMMLPEGWVTDVPGLTRTVQLRLLGNGVVPPQAAHALRLLGVGQLEEAA